MIGSECGPWGWVGVWVPIPEAEMFGDSLVDLPVVCKGALIRHMKALQREEIHIFL